MEVRGPWKWKHLQEYKKDPHKFATIPRKNDVNYEHQKLTEIPSSIRSENLIKELKFDKDNLFALVDNSYPYDIEPGIRHMVLFINPKYADKFANPKIIEYLVSSNAWKMGYTDYLYFENPPERRSVPEIIHYHVFFTNKISSKSHL